MELKKEKLIGFWLTHISMALRGEIDSRMSELGLKGPDAIILIMLHSEGSSSLLKLARHIHQAHPTVLRNLDTLEKSKLLIRVSDKIDRRKKVLKLTPEGRRLVPAIKKILIELNHRALSDFSPDEKTQLFSFMRRIAHNSGAAHLLRNGSNHHNK